MVSKRVSENFRFYFSQGLVKLNPSVDEKKLQLYKMSQVEKLRDHSRRFTLPFMLDENYTPTEISDFNHMENLDKL